MAFSTMYTNVLNRGRQSGDWATARVKDYLNKAQGVIWRKAKEWTKLEQQDTTTGVVGQENYALPDYYERMISLQLESGGITYPINELSYDSILAGLELSGNARPWGYCVNYQQLFFNRPLDVAYTIRWDYIKQLADMSGDSDTTPLPEYIIEEYAYAFLMRDLGHDKKFSDAFQNFQQMLEDYAESDGRGEALHGFNDGLVGHTHYWKAGYMWGGTRSRWYDR